MIRSTAIVLACFATTILSGTAASAADGEVAAEMMAGIERRTTAAVSLLERIVNVNSGTMNFAGVRTVARLLEPEFTALGFTTRWVEGNAFDRSGHLIATRPGSGPKIVLIGHLDTVFEPDSPLQRFERLDGNLARGPGVTDMKGGIVVMLEALRALGEVRGLGAFDFAVVLHGDEEDPGTPLDRARQDLIALARDAQVAIGFEDGDGRLETAEDFRLGVVLGSRGYRFVIDRRIQGVHLKSYTAGGILREDRRRVADLRRVELAPEERQFYYRAHRSARLLSLVLPSLIAVNSLASIWFPQLLWVGLILLLLFVGLNFRFFNFCRRERGWLFGIFTAAFFAMEMTWAGWAGLESLLRHRRLTPAADEAIESD